MGTLIAGLVVLGIVMLAARSVCKARKQGGCAGCTGCCCGDGHSCGDKEKTGQ